MQYIAKKTASTLSTKNRISCETETTQEDLKNELSK